MRVGKEPSLKDKLKDLTKISKEDVIKAGHKIIKEVVAGNSAEYGDFIMVLFDDKTFCHVPASSMDYMAENVGEDFSNGQYVLVMEVNKSRNDKDYYTCYVDELKNISK